MAEVKKINGYTIKDEIARNRIETLQSGVNGLNESIQNLNSSINDSTAQTNLNTQNIETINQQIEDLNKNTGTPKGKYIFIGDSYAQGYSPDGNVTGWATRVQSSLNINENDCIKKSYGGVGFCNVVDGKTFLSLLKEISTDKPEDIKYIVVVGGYNDKGYNASDIDTAIGLFCTYAKQTYPNAKICIGMCGFSTDATALHDLSWIVRPYALCGKHGAVYMGNIEYALHRISYMASDGYHPNEYGQTQLAAYISSFLAGESITVNELLFTNMQGVEGVTTNNSYKTVLNNNVSCLTMARQTYNFDSQQVLNAHVLSRVPLCILNDGCIIGGRQVDNTYNLKTVKVTLSNNGDENKTVMGSIGVINKTVYLYLLDNESITFNRAVIEAFTLMFDSMSQGG